MSSTSLVKARITSANQALVPGSELGQVLDLPYQIPVPNTSDKAKRFGGKLYLWIGPQTYSQAIVFATTMKDHKLATIIGQNTEGPANQTGQVQVFELPKKPGQPHLILILQHSATFAMVAELSRRMKGGLINTNGLCGK